MAWQFTSEQPIYLQIVDEIQMRILNGTYEMGERLPSVRDLAQVAAVNPNTMQRALTELENLELIRTQRNSGKTVTTDQGTIEKARGAKAKAVVEAFLSKMHALGIEKSEALALLNEQEIKEEVNGSDTGM